MVPGRLRRKEDIFWLTLLALLRRSPVVRQPGGYKDRRVPLVGFERPTPGRVEVR